MSLRLRIIAPVAVLLAAGLLWLGSSPVAAQDSLEQAIDDDLGLIAYAGYTKDLVLGSQDWEVWICDVGGPLNHNLSSITAILNDQIKPYFAWLSGGRYNPTFSSAGSVQSDDGSCPIQVGKAGGNQTRPAITINNNVYISGWGWPGYFVYEESGISWSSQANAVVGGGSVVATEGSDKPELGFVVHAIGQALAFPLSYGGSNIWEDGIVDNVDNPMDVMSGGTFSGLEIATLAVNRYAAGWIDLEDVVIHEAGVTTYELSPLGVSGDQMLVIPTGEGPGVFYSLSARVSKEYDRAIPTEGVEVYLVDQRPSACEFDQVCWGAERRTQPIPPDKQGYTTFHVLKVGDGMDLGGVRVEVTARKGDRFSVRVGKATNEQASRLERTLDDDLSLIAFADNLRELSLGDQEWEVWACYVGGSLSLDLPSITRLLNQQITPYFVWLSAGRYTPRFTQSGAVRATDRDGCEEQVEMEGRNRDLPVVIIDDDLDASGFGGPGGYFEYGNSIAWAGASLAVVGGASMVTTEEWGEPVLGTVAHEIGHALGLPHSYGGRNFWEEDGIYITAGDVHEYDNPMDIMSASNQIGLGLGTIAVNRYAAGWIDPGDVAVYEAGDVTYALSPLGVSGDQMLVIPAEGGPGVFYTLGARVAKGNDRDIPTAGVEVYLVDQRTTVCEDERFACWGTDRRTQQVPADDEPFTTLHVLDVGQSMDLGEVRVEVTGRRGDRFIVLVDGEDVAPPEPVSSCQTGNFVGLFCDEDGSVHESNIETLAGWQITLGCEDNRFCPQNLITRNQMAAFLYRAVARQYGTPQVGAVDIADVGSDAWYSEFAQWAVSAGVMSLDDGQFKPQNVVTRADMAVMMTAAFPDLIPTGGVQRVFTDTTGLNQSTLVAIESLYRAGVSLGCSTSPLQFCPDQPVTRAQMASFFVRALSNPN